MVPEPSHTSILKFKEYKDAAPACKVVLLQDLKMQFVRLETSKESINPCKEKQNKNTKLLQQKNSLS